MRFSWTQERGILAVSVAIMALHGAQAALAQQFVPYSGGMNQAYSQYQANAPQQTQPQYTAMAYQGSDVRSTNQPAESVAPGQMQGNSMAPAQTMNYPQPDYAGYGSGSCASGSWGAYNTFDGGCGNGGCATGGCDTGCGWAGQFLKSLRVRMLRLIGKRPI